MNRGAREIRAVRRSAIQKLKQGVMVKQGEGRSNERERGEDVVGCCVVLMFGCVHASDTRHRIWRFLDRFLIPGQFLVKFRSPT